MKYKSSYFCKLGHYFFSITLFFIYSISNAATAVSPVSTYVELYNTFTLKFLKDDITTNKFLEFPKVIFTKGEKTFTVEGFFDGDENGSTFGNIWKTRFVPNEVGAWNYTWNFGTANGNGSFSVATRTNTKNRGHVSRSGRYLKTSDGKNFIYYGSNWPQTMQLRPTESANSRLFISDSDWVNYINRLTETNHNGTYLMGLDRPLNNDRTSFDLNWLNKIDTAIEVAASSGIYVILGIFDTWGRDTTDPYATSTNSSGQILDPWSSSNLMAEKEFYLRYIISRYAGFYNIFWELGNEMGRSPNNGGKFTAAANNDYIPWIKKYDPYNLPITLSEGLWRTTNIEIGGFHQNQAIDLNESSPIIHTELVGGGAPSAMWETSTYADPDNRHYYRKTIWKSMVEGGSGSIEGSSLSSAGYFSTMTEFLNNVAIRNVMEDHGRLSLFLLLTESQLNSFFPKGASGLGSSNTAYKYRSNNNLEYLAYFYGADSPVTLSLTLPQGSYTIVWYSPSTGLTSTQTVSNNSSITSPWETEYDVAIYIVADTQTVVPSPPSSEKLIIN